MNENKNNFFIEVFRFSLLVIFIVLPFRLFIAKPFIVSGESMHPTFLNGDYLIVDQISYRVEKPERGEVIVFKYPNDTKKFFIKRIIGLPEETIEINNNQVKIKNKNNPEGIVLEEKYLNVPTLDRVTYTLDKNEYFVMGDNRINSSDSRSWGPLDEKFIAGRAFVRLLPITKIDLMPGNFNY